MDEDRPNMCEDCIYDNIRAPLFGRSSDIESIVIIGDKVEFPGTHSGEQKWNEKVPHHGETSIELSKFGRKDDTDLIIWSNTWNHLLGEKNNNPDMEITYQQALPAGSVETKKRDQKDFVVRLGSRAQVDARFKGLLTTLSTVITPERAEKLGQRSI